MLESACAAIEHANICVPAGVHCAILIWIVSRESLRARSVNHHELIASLKASSLDDFALNGDITEAFSENILRCFTLSVTSVPRDGYHYRFARGTLTQYSAEGGRVVDILDCTHAHGGHL